MKKAVKGTIRLLIAIIAATALVVGIKIFTDGMYLLGIPDLKDGTDKIISANNTTVWWNGKTYVTKDKEMFVNLTEEIFFLEDLPE